MKYEILRRGEIQVLRIGEDLAVGATPKFRDVLEEVSPRGYEKLVLDLGGVQFMGSMAIAALFGLHRRLKEGGGEVCFARVGPHLAKIFEIVGLPALVKDFDDEEAAVGYLEAVGQHRSGGGRV